MSLLRSLFFSILFFSIVQFQESHASSETISRFQQYLQINTAHPHPKYSEAADFIISQAKGLQLESETLEFVKGKPVILLKWTGKNPKLPSVLFNSHADVVPAEHHKWNHPPLSAHIDQSGKLPLCPLLGLVSSDENYRAFYAERCPWWLTIKATGAPGHGSKLYDNSAMENLFKSIESIRKFRASQFDMVKAGLKAEGEVVSVNMVFLKAGTPSPTGFVMNMQPSEAEAGFDIRVPPTTDTESLEKRIAEEWAPASRNMTFQFKHKVSAYDKFGKPAVTAINSSNQWWSLLEGAVKKAGGKLHKPEIFPASTDARYFREKGLPAFGFSPMANTPILLHDHNEILNQAEYLKGIEIYESIIKAYASFIEESGDKTSREEL